MPGWNGSGLVPRLYNFVADAAAGTKILASRIDAEYNSLITAIQNTLALDGQTKPSANIDWNAKKITNLAAGTAAGDAVNFGQLASLDWVSETHGLQYVSATSFKVLAADVSATYHVGRRVKTTNTGGTAYSTVTAVSYSAPDTTITVFNDSTALDSGLSAAWYGMLTYTNRSYLSPQSVVQARLDYAGSYTQAGTATKVTLNTEDIDTLGEFSSSRFTAKLPGFYQIFGMVEFYNATGLLAANRSVSVKKNGTTTIAVGNACSPTTLTLVSAQVFVVALLAVGDYIELFSAGSTADTVTGDNNAACTSLTISRLP